MRRALLIFTALFILCVCTVQALAGPLTLPFSTDTAGMLPKKIRNARVTMITTEVENMLNAQGDVQNIAFNMNRTLTWNDLAKGYPAGMERDRLLGYLEAKNFNPDQAVGETHGIANSRVTATVPVLAFGFSEKVTLAVAVPIVYSYVNVDYGWTSRPVVSEVLSVLANDGKYSQVTQAVPKLENVVATEFLQKGYVLPRDQEKTQVGDLSLVGKVRILEATSWALNLQPRAVLPTGRRPDINNAFDVGAGDGQFDLGLGLVGDYNLGAKTTLSASLSYLNQLPGKAPMRIPQNPIDRLTPDVDGSTEINLGDIYSAGAGGKYKLTKTWILGAGGSLQYKEPDRYSGGAYSSERYDHLSIETEQFMASALATVSYSTIQLFREKRFPVPLEASVIGSQVFTGRNVRKNSLAGFELAMFF